VEEEEDVLIVELEPSVTYPEMILDDTVVVVADCPWVEMIYTTNSVVTTPRVETVQLSTGAKRARRRVEPFIAYRQDRAPTWRFCSREMGREDMRGRDSSYPYFPTHMSQMSYSNQRQ